MILVLTGTLASTKTYSKSLFFNSDLKGNNCPLTFSKKSNKVNSKILKYINKFLDNSTELNISQSESFTRFSPKNNRVQNSCNDNPWQEERHFIPSESIDRTLAFNGENNFREVKANSPFSPPASFDWEVKNCAQCQSRQDYQQKKSSIVYKNKEIELIAKTIWGEGRGESYEGKVAIGNVIMNRYKISQATRKSDWWGNTIEQIILHPYQFSCHNHNDPNKSKIALLTSQDSHYRESLKIARGILSGAIKDNTLGATHYFAYKTVRPRWASKMKKTKRIGNHDFYKNN